MKKQATIFLCSLLSLLPTLLFAAPQERTLVMAFSPAAPLKILLSDGRYSGVDVELMQQICQRLSLQLVIRPMPLARAQEMMKYGQVDVMTGILRTPEREAFIDYIEPPYLMRNDKVFYMRADSSLVLDRYEELIPLHIGVKRGAHYDPRFDLDTALRKSEVTTTEQSFRKLQQHRIDTLITTEIEGDYLIKSYGWEGTFRKAPLRFSSLTGVYIGFSKASPHHDLIPEISHELAHMVANGDIDRLMTSYIGVQQYPQGAGGNRAAP